MVAHRSSASEGIAMPEPASAPYQGPSKLTHRLLEKRTDEGSDSSRTECSRPHSCEEARRLSGMPTVSAAQASFEMISVDATSKLALAPPPMALDRALSLGACPGPNEETEPMALAYLHSVFNETERGRLLLAEARVPRFQPTSQRPPASHASYTPEVMQAVRRGDLPRLRRHLEAGHSLDYANDFGETLLHVACRRSQVETARFLVEQARVRTDAPDDFGRTPVHDACWTAAPNTELMRVLLPRVPAAALVRPDIRGHTPFHYARKEHQPEWTAFLKDHKDVLVGKLEEPETGDGKSTRF